MIRIGTSGFHYDDWIGPFYPEGCSTEQFLSIYATHFNALELNFSFYRMPTSGQMESFIRRTDGKVVFAVKAHRSFTHDRTAGHNDLLAFQEALRPLREADLLCATLLQFPGSFRQTEENRRYLKSIGEQLHQPVFEFRNVEWSEPAILKWLFTLRFGYCCVDEPSLPGLMPPLAVATSQVAYVRFHGRNTARWYAHNQPHERYDYRYSTAEISEWVGKIINLDRQAEHTLVFFNNHFAAKAVDGAKNLARLLQAASHGEMSR